jgi:hypothetical protein
VSVVRVEGLPDAAAVAGGELVWLLAPGARPRDGALEALLSALEDPRLVLAAGVVVGPDRMLRAELAGRPEPHDVEALLDAARDRTLPLRACPFANVLVRAEAFARTGLPDPADGAHADRIWTARLLAAERGRLVPASVVELAGRAAPRDARSAVRALRAGAWTRSDAVRALIDGMRRSPGRA